jgi:hypothetical protein
VDFSRFGIEVARSRPATPASPVSFDVVNLLDLRAVLRLGAQCAAEERPWTLFGRRLLNAMEAPGRDNVFRLCDMLVRRGGEAHFDLVTDAGYTGIPPYLRPSMDEVRAEAAGHGLVLEEATTLQEPMTWVGVADEQLVELHRMTFRRRLR